MQMDVYHFYPNHVNYLHQGKSGAPGDITGALPEGHCWKTLRFWWWKKPLEVTASIVSLSRGSRTSLHVSLLGEVWEDIEKVSNLKGNHKKPTCHRRGGIDVEGEYILNIFPPSI